MLANMTGYASIDKPWLKWHGEILQEDYAGFSNYFDYFSNVTAQYGNMRMLEYVASVYTRNDLIAEAEKKAYQLARIGVCKGDIVSMMMLNVPEVIILTLALLKIGACCNLIKYDESPERINASINLTKSKLMFISQVPGIVQTVSTVADKNSIIQTIIEVPLAGNTSLLNSNFILYSDFFSNQNTSDGFKFEQTSPNDTAVIVYSGGTTGDAKGIEITHRNLMAMCFGLKYSNYGFTSGKSSMNILPPAVAYYLNATLGMMFCGISVMFIPYFQIEEYPLLIDKCRPDIIISGPILLKMLQASSIQDFSYLTNPISGGDKLYPAEEEDINHALAAKNCPSGVQQGYGESEVSAVATCNPVGNLVVGSIGIPMVNVTVSIFEYGTDKELKYGGNEIGEICISGPTLMKGYYNHPDATANVLRLHSDGKYWVHTDDLGRMDANGFIFHCGRAKRMLTRSGTKVWLSEIESAATTLDSISECCAVKMDDSDEREVPVLHIVLKSEVETDIVAKLDTLIGEKCSNAYIPRYYVIRESIPYTETNKKMDYRKLEKEDIFDTNAYIHNGRLIQRVPR